MAASDLDDLLKFEAHIEGAAATFLNTATGLSCFTTASESVLTLPRIDVRLDMGEAFNPPAPRNGGAAPASIDFRAYRATFLAEIATDNAVGQSASMAAHRTKCRVALMRSADNWDSTSLPYYDIKELRPLGEEIMVDDDLNITALNYSLVFEIRDDAWPA